jgi:hypothetical protein
MVKIKDFLTSLDLPYRGDCPSCGHKNTFSAQEENGQIIYNCFHASCKLKGKTKGFFSIDKIKKIDIIDREFDQKIYNWSNPLQNETCLKYINKYHLLEAYADNRISLRYDPKTNRCVFILKDHNNIEQGATGRSLDGVTPKWYIYERYKTCPFIVKGKENVEKLIIVEDCASAARISYYCSSIALLGTNFNFNFKYIEPFKDITIALDDDATIKSLHIQKYINFYIPCKISAIKKDLKYFSDSELEELIMKGDNKK